jgi:hypothetical protein
MHAKPMVSGWQTIPSVEESVFSCCLVPFITFVWCSISCVMNHRLALDVRFIVLFMILASCLSDGVNVYIGKGSAKITKHLARERTKCARHRSRG